MYAEAVKMENSGIMCVAIIIAVLAVSFFFTCRSYVRAKKDLDSFNFKILKMAREAQRIKRELMRKKAAENAEPPEQNISAADSSGAARRRKKAAPAESEAGEAPAASEGEDGEDDKKKQ